MTALVGMVGSLRFQAVAIEKVPVTALFRCDGGQPTDLVDPPTPCSNGDRLAGDSHGPYVGVPTGPRTPAQNTYITSDGVFWFAQQVGSGRSVFFDLSKQVDPSPPDVRQFQTAWSTDFQPNWLAAPIGVRNGMWGMLRGQVAEGTLKANFNNAYDTYRWTVRFDRNGYPGSTNLTFTCTTRVVGASACSGWTIEAKGDYVARLIGSTTSGKEITFDEGTFRLPFLLNVSYP
jgi:hypothetical protein